MPEAIELPPRLDLTAVSPLSEQLRNCSDGFLIDAAKVTHMGALCMQAIVAASRAARAADVPFDLINVSDALKDQMVLLGCPAEQLVKGEI